MSESTNPSFDAKNAKPVSTLFPHCETKRTIAFSQGAGDSNVHLFSATYQYIGTCTAAEFAEAHAKAESDARAEARAAKKANDEEHAKRMAKLKKADPAAAEPATPLPAEPAPAAAAAADAIAAEKSPASE